MTTNENDQNNKDREIREWKQRFLQLWDDIDKENRSVGSHRIQVVLYDYSHFAGIASRDLDAG